MNNPTMMDAEQAAELLGVDIYTLSVQLRYAAADELERLAGRIRRRDDEPIDVGRARRLLRAAHAALKADNAVDEAREKAEA